MVASSSSVHEVRRLIFAGFGIGCLPEHVAQPDVAQQRLQRLPPGEGVADVDIHLLWSRERKYSQAETLFLVSLNQWLEKRERLGQAD
ncbi:LysR substrate binding domain protein [compost metagenome]